MRALESAQVFIPALPGVGGLTNAEGRFLLLNVPAGTYEVQVELIGYQSGSQTVTVTTGESTTVEFQIYGTALAIQELVVTGVAGSTPKVKLPFTVEKVDIAESPVKAPSADALIQGKVPAAKVVRGSGKPGDEASIMLRGPTSLTGSQAPLIIVDGVITDNTLADIDALDVSSVEVVKGAAAASLYGSRAANGVVQITTKRGSDLTTDRARVIYRGEYGNQSLEGSIRLAKAHPYQMNSSGTSFIDASGNEIDYGTGVVLDKSGPNGMVFQDKRIPGKTYDHIEAFFDPGDYLSNYVAVEGKSGNTSYRASFTDYRESGVVDGNDGFDRKNVRVNVDHQVWDNLDLSLNTYYAQSEQDEIGGNPFFGLTFMSPAVDLSQKDENGDYLYQPDPLSLEENPLYPIQQLDNVDKRQRFMSSIFARWRPATWFELEGNFSLDRYDFHRQNLTPKGYKNVDNPEGDVGSIYKFNSLSNDINGSLTASINKTWDDFTTRIKFRYLIEDQHTESFSASGNDLAVADVPVLDVTQAGKSVASSVTDVVSEGYFAIAAFDYAGKYIFDVLFRRDGSSLFGEDERWQNYYRGSFKWRMGQEGFWPFDAIDEFSPRISYGTAGDRPGFSAQYETYSVSGGRILPSTLGNRDLKPALATELEAGVDIVLWNKVATGVTYANSVVEDQFLAVPLPGFAGFNSQWRNAGTLESNTWEAYVEAAIIDGGDWTWSSRFNWDRTRQEITELNVPPYRFGPNSEFYMREGESLGTFYGTRWATSCKDLGPGEDCNLFQKNDDGYLVYVGAGNSYKDGFSKNLWGTSENGYDWGMPVKGVECETVDGEESCNDFLNIGNTTPDFTFSWSNTLRWRNLDFYFLLDWEQGTQIYNQTSQWAMREWKNSDADQVGKADELKKPVDYYSAFYNVNATSSYFVEDGSYVKIREASLRYSFYEDQIASLFGGRTLGLTQASINLIGRNLFTFTDYGGYDPEVGTGSGGSSAIGRTDDYAYPNFRTITASIELIF
jgi:TonB-linked SusC/RagA family outer membrane protein